MTDASDPNALQERLERLRELTDFTEKCQKQIQDLFQTLGWSQDYPDGAQETCMQLCPYDPDHRVALRSTERHKASCMLRKMGYSAEEQAEMCDPSVCYQRSSVRTFSMDKSTQHQVILQARSAAPLMKMEGVFWQGQYTGTPVEVPQNHKRAVCDLTVADRLALYDHVIHTFSQQGQQPSNEDLYTDLVSKLQRDEEQKEPKTHLELMAEMRDYKRRRQSYRAKNVHITKKSYTEVIREVIKVHSEELARQWREEEDEEEEEKKGVKEEQSSSRRGPGERRSASTESRQSRGRRHRSRGRSHEEGKKRRKRDAGSEERSHDRKKKKKKKKEK